MKSFVARPLLSDVVVVVVTIRRDYSMKQIPFPKYILTYIQKQGGGVCVLAPAGHTDKWDSVYGIRRRTRTLI